MPSYAGGKSRKGSQIAQVIFDLERTYFGNGQPTLIEPFAGFLGVSIHFAIHGRYIVSNDKNSDIISMWKEIKRGWIPPEEPVSMRLYNNLRSGGGTARDRGFYGVACA